MEYKYEINNIHMFTTALLHPIRFNIGCLLRSTACYSVSIMLYMAVLILYASHARPGIVTNAVGSCQHLVCEIRERQDTHVIQCFYVM